MTRLAAIPPPATAAQIRLAELARVRATLGELGAASDDVDELDFAKDYGRHWRPRR